MILRMLLVLSFFPAVQVTDKILVKQPHLLVAYHHEVVNLPCNYIYDKTPTEFRASLHMGKHKAHEVCSVYVNGTHKPWISSSEDFSCHVDFDNKTVMFRLWNMSIFQTDFYFCKIEFMYPPPYFSSELNNGTFISVTEKDVCPTLGTSEPPKPFWPVVAALCVFAFYSMLITVAFCNCWLKSKKNRILHSDYMNMTPRRPGPIKKHQPYAPTRDYAAYRS
ncbi:T-cell-specific surface glycoprotein CD28 [Gracilinanus agilis]|uniref:T-cell-specific surface glycoprotein CD28 n=1 Tax=Gracilinanus agilis TaxID=191870 RepID=UPI001CFD65FB|nr:T-cell-specific surface glycoprotein CD28 [Gracilinanus agilis]